MRPVDIKTINYRGSRASRRRGVGKKTWLILAGAFLFLGGLGYALFYARWLQVDSLAFQGVSDQHQAEVRPAIDEVLNRKVLGLPVGKSIVFLKSGALKASLAEQFPFLKEISVKKDYFHTLEIRGTEREAEGVWCFGADTAVPSCQYFDHGGVLWGQAIQSSGVLFLNIDDERVVSFPVSAVDQSFLKGIQTVVAGLKERGIKFKRIVIPSGSFTEFDVIVSDGYPAKFSLDSDLPGQLKVYEIFKKQKLDSNQVRPQYIDLRFDGRVYYK